jgi:hypothetical protein
VEASPGYRTVRLWSTNVWTRSPTANGGVGFRARGAGAGAARFVAVVDPAVPVVDPAEAVVDPAAAVAVRGRAAVRLVPPQPAITAAIAIAAPIAATPRIRNADGEAIVSVGGEGAIHRCKQV